MDGELALFAVGSNGSVGQWDGNKTPKGMLLRWLQRPGLGFPDYGFDVYRAEVGDRQPFVWSQHERAMTGQTEYATPDGEIVFSCAGGFSFTSINGRTALELRSGNPVTARFPDPSWVVGVNVLPGNGAVATVSAGGHERGHRVFGPSGGHAAWRTRGIEMLVLDGEAPVDDLDYMPLHAKRGWNHLIHLSLPVADPGYPDSIPNAADEETVASSRVPTGVDWAGRYSPEFPALRDHLRALATHTPLPATVPAAGSGADGPVLTMSSEQAVAVATLDPHLARAVGFAYDDALSAMGLDGREYAYRVVGRWRGRARTIALSEVSSTRTVPRRGNLMISPARSWRLLKSSLRLELSASPVFVMSTTAHELRLAGSGSGFSWEAWHRGTQVGSGTVASLLSPGELAIWPGGAFSELRITGAGQFTITAITTHGVPLTHESVLPSILAAESGPPAGPAWLDAVIGQPGGASHPPRATLRWDVALTPGNAFPEGGCFLYQVAGARIGADPALPKPPAPSWDDRYVLFEGDPVLVPPGLAAADPPEAFAIHRPLAEGWYAWHARGVDLFGRVSAPSTADVERVEDIAAPPPPALILADYAQADLSADQALLRGRSSLASAWLAAHPGDDAAVVVWGWTPELEAMCPDVDGFRLYARRPASNGWDSASWGTAIAAVGPIATRIDGTVTASHAGLTDVTVYAVAGIGALDPAHPTGAHLSRCTTDLILDSGAGALAGARLRTATFDFLVEGNGDGVNAVLVVSHPSGAPPVPGTYSLEAGTTSLCGLTTDISVSALDAEPLRRRIAGVIVAGEERLLMLGRQPAGTLIGRLPADPETGTSIGAHPGVGDTISWYPAYVWPVSDNGFGPQAGLAAPVAHAQMTVTAVRRTATRPVESQKAAPALLTAVDVAPPTTPTVPPIQSGVHCAQLASAPDWYGISRFSFSWNAVTGVAGYIVLRATADAIWHADREAQAGSAHAFPSSALPTDPSRRTATLADLAALDAALATGDDGDIDAAYAALRADAAQLLAGQDSVRSAYTELTAAPLPGAVTKFEDRLDGKSAQHWFYRVAARSHSGVIGAPSAPTPPICAPDVVAPQAPRVQLALAGPEQVTLRWAPNAERDLSGYELLRAPDEPSAADVRDMVHVAEIAPTPSATASGTQVLPAQAGTLLEHVDDGALGGREWFYRLVAVDSAGNRSAPSTILRARSLLAIPDPPVVAAPVRSTAGIRLTWTHADPRLACLVERRPDGSDGLWQTVSPDGWLPRGVYFLDDVPRDPDAAWSYRVRVKNIAGHLAPTIPSVTIATV